MTLTPLAEHLLETIYYRTDERGKPIEDWPHLCERVCKAVLGGAGDEVHIPEMLRAMVETEFLPNSPTLMNAGTEYGTLSACFLLPLEDSLDSILSVQAESARIHASGGGTGYPLHRLRPAGDRIARGGTASGPIAFMSAIDGTTEAIKQGGRRRGGCMGVMAVGHPDIKKFIECKKVVGTLPNFNTSVLVTDAFMQAVMDDKEHALQFTYDTEPRERVSAKQLFNDIVTAAWSTGEPGLLFYDTLNRSNVLPEYGPIDCCNVCGEVVLPPPAACNLGSIDVAKFVEGGDVHWSRLRKMVHLAIRFLDDVVTVNRYPDPLMDERARATRVIGLGIMGWANLLIKLHVAYGSEKSLELANTLGGFLYSEALKASQGLAWEKHPCDVQPPSAIASAVRNASLLSFAPTGTLSYLADTSSGIEPNFGFKYTRTILGQQIEMVHPLVPVDYEPSLNPPQEFITAHEIPPSEHVSMQAMFQKNVDGGISKTANLSHSATVDDVWLVMEEAWKLGCKGITIFRDGCRGKQMLTKKEHVGERPETLHGGTKQLPVGCGHLYVTINKDEGDKMYEAFITLGKGGGCPAQSEAIGRLVSLCCQRAVDVSDVVHTLRGIKCTATLLRRKKDWPLSCPDAMARAIEAFNGHVSSDVSLDLCPECEQPGLIRAGGCVTCELCGYSRCG